MTVTDDPAADQDAAEATEKTVSQLHHLTRRDSILRMSEVKAAELAEAEPLDGENWLCEASDGGGTTPDDSGGGDGVPASWSCSESFYDSNDGCDCGCGPVDPDCESSSASVCDYEYCDHDEEVSPNSNGLCVSDGAGDGGDGGDGLPPSCDLGHSEECTAGNSCQFNYPTHGDQARCWWIGTYSVSGCESRTLPQTNPSSNFDCPRSDCIGDWHCGLGETCEWLDQADWIDGRPAKECRPV